MDGFSHDASHVFSSAEEEIYAQWLKILESAEIEYAVGGAYALGFHTNIWRNTKDLDIFVTPADLRKTLKTMQESGFWTTVKNTSWLAKFRSENYFMDLIFGLSNHANKIDRSWIENAVPAEIFGISSRVLRPEEFLASKVYVMRRERFDGSDIAHLIRAVKGRLNWERILEILQQDRQLLLWHLLFFDYVYPGHSNYLPTDLMAYLFDKAKRRWQDGNIPKEAFFGMRVDPKQFEIDLDRFSYKGEKRGPLVDEKGKEI
ncbi:MAG: nucleotidyltransferase [Desulfobacterales bacterium]